MPAAEPNWTTLIVAVLGTGGVSVFLREIIAGAGKIGRGVSLRSRDRQRDLVRELSTALANYERERANRWAVEDYAARLRRKAIERGDERDLPAPPVLVDTISPAEMRELRSQPPTEETP
jgi:hypothetical protein